MSHTEMNGSGNPDRPLYVDDILAARESHAVSPSSVEHADDLKYRATLALLDGYKAYEPERADNLREAFLDPGDKEDPHAADMFAVASDFDDHESEEAQNLSDIAQVLGAMALLVALKQAGVNDKAITYRFTVAVNRALELVPPEIKEVLVSVYAGIMLTGKD